MGADYFELGRTDSSQLPMGIGRNCVIDRAIIDKNARIADGVVITPEGKPPNLDAENYFIRDGIVVIPKTQSFSRFLDLIGFCCRRGVMTPGTAGPLVRPCRGQPPRLPSICHSRKLPSVFPTVLACSRDLRVVTIVRIIDQGSFLMMSRMRTCPPRTHTAEQGRQLFEGYGLCQHKLRCLRIEFERRAPNYR